jgi:hypothetical protein
MQKRGAVHYHIVCWFPGKAKMPFPDDMGWWKHGMSNCKFATSPVGYIAKYASKGPDSALPKGARIWGYGGLDDQKKNAVRHALAPSWLRKVIGPTSQLKQVQRTVTRVIKYSFGYVQEKVERCRGFVDYATGFFYLSPWERLGFTTNGLALRHQGFVEAFFDGQRYHIPQGEERFI